MTKQPIVIAVSSVSGGGKSIVDVVRPSSDLILDWDQTPEVIASGIVDALKEKHWL